jgi:hypothetical protein
MTMPKRPKPKQPAPAQRSAPNWWGRIIGGGVLTILIALCGLYLQWHNGARRLDVKLLWGTAAYRGGAEQRVGLHLAAANPGHQPVRVTKAGIFLPDGPPIPESSPYCIIPSSGNWEFPCYVDPDDNRVITLDGPRLTAFCEALVNGGRTGTVALVGFYVEGSDLESRRPHKSIPLQFDIGEALKLARAQTQHAASAGAGGTRESR